MADNDISLTKGTNDLPPLSLGEVGQSGLIVLGGNIFEECQYELQWPQAIDTFKEMAKDASIAAALEYVDSKVSTVEWEVNIPDGYEDTLKDHAEFLRQCQNDMVHDWRSFIKQANSFGRYGFACVEKVYRYRKKENGSKYDDNLIGIKKLAIRSQDSVDRWKWSGNGKDLAGFYQNIIQYDDTPQEGWGYATPIREVTQKFIRRAKFLLFRHNPIKNSPTGTSPLAGVWKAWKMKKAYEESEALGCAQDANAFKILYVPPQYLMEDASEEDRATKAEFEKILVNSHKARQSGILLPYLETDSGNKMFEFDVKNISGTARYDTNSIIQRFNNEILVGLFADVLAMGNSGGGSYSMAESKLTVIDLAVRARLDEIKEQINNDLVRQLFELNGWDTSVMPYFDYVIPEEVDLDNLSKFVQRTAAVGMMPITPQTVNWIMRRANIPFQVDENMTTEELQKILSPMTSNSGQGMQEGMGSGTGAATGASGDSSTNNSENAA